MFIEDHGRLLLVALIGIVVLLGWAGVLGDSVMGGILLTALFGVTAAVVLARVVEEKTTGRRLVGALLGAVALAVAAWTPFALLTDQTLVGSAELPRNQAELSVDAASGKGPWFVYLHASPQSQVGTVSVDIDWRTPKDHLSHGVTLQDEMRASRRGASSVHREVALWRLRSDLSAGAHIAVQTKEPDKLQWPVHVEIRRAPIDLPILGGIAGVLALLALVWDRFEQREHSIGLSGLALGGAVFAAVFAYAYAPGGLTKAAFVSGISSVLVGSLGGALLIKLVRRRQATA